MSAPHGSARRFCVTVLLDVFLVSPLSAQTSSVLAAVPGSARAAGMGGAGAAVVGDAGAVFTNPAGLATIHRLAVEASYESYPSGSTLSTGRWRCARAGSPGEPVPRRWGRRTRRRIF